MVMVVQGGVPLVGCLRWGEGVSVCRSVGLMVCQVWLLACFLVVCQVVVGLWWVLGAPGRPPGVTPSVFPI